MARPTETAARKASAQIDFDAWMRAEQRRIYLLSLHMLGEPDEADTVTQEVFLKAYRALSSPNGRAPDDPAKWLTRVAVNSCLDRLRSRRWWFWRRRVAPKDEDALLALTRDPAPSAEARLLGSEIAIRLAQALQGLSARQRSVFVLKHYEDRKLEEIAEILGLDVGTVKAHLARALAKLRRELHDLYFGPPADRNGRQNHGT